MLVPVLDRCGLFTGVQRGLSFINKGIKPHPCPFGGALKLWLGSGGIEEERHIAGIMSEILGCDSCSNRVISDSWV